MGVGAMTSRERIIAAMEGRPVDRLPLMLWIEAHTLLKLAEHVRPPRRLWLKLALGALNRLPGSPPPLDQVKDAIGLAAGGLLPEYAIDLGADAVDMFWGRPDLWVRKLKPVPHGIEVADAFGTVRRFKGLYLEITQTPCRTADDLVGYEFPDLAHPSHYGAIRAFKRLHPETFVFASVPGVQDWSQHLFPMEKLYETAALEPDKLKVFFDKLERFSIQIIEGSIKAGADGIMILDDYGMQDRLLMSERMWLELTWPHLRNQIAAAHRLGGKAMLHSCGYQMPLIEHYIRAGLDALQSFQPGAGNDVDEFVERFGGRLCLFTGVDSQKIGRQSVDEALADIRNMVGKLRRTGKYVLCPAHALQVDIPIPMLRAVMDVMDELRVV